MSMEPVQLAGLYLQGQRICCETSPASDVMGLLLTKILHWCK